MKRSRGIKKIVYSGTYEYINKMFKEEKSKKIIIDYKIEQPATLYKVNDYLLHIYYI